MRRFQAWLRSFVSSRAQSQSRRSRLGLTPLEERDVPAAAVFSVVNTWTSGEQGQIAITNSAGPALNGWQIAFDFTGDISQVWNAKLVSHTGTRYTFADAGWNASIPVGGQQSFGFVSTLAAADRKSTRLNSSHRT